MPAIESVEVLDRFNGVPTFGLFSTGGERQLFWRVTGYVPRSYSIWLYIPLTTDDENRLAHAEPSDLLGGLVFGSSAPRYATVGVAKDYRLVFEREWRISQDTDPQRVFADVLGFLLDAPSRRVTGQIAESVRLAAVTTKRGGCAQIIHSGAVHRPGR